MLKRSTEFAPKTLQLFIWSFIWFMLITCYMLQSYSAIEAVARGSHDTFVYILIIYTNILLFIPYLYQQRKTAGYVLASIGLLLLSTIGRVQLQHYFNTQLFSDHPANIPIPFGTYSFIFFSHVLVFLSSIGFKLAIDYFTLRIQKEQLMQQQSASELNLLKAQVQPHFLFNTLNNIYSVAEQESPTTAVLLEQLSSIMRYFVEEAPKEKIMLDSELHFIENYIHLENLRMRFPLKVEWEKRLTDPLLIPPMLLIPLIENVFKHGINKLEDHNYMNIKVSEAESSLFVTVENRFTQAEQIKKSGTGLKNLKERLSLLFGQQFLLSTEAENHTFKTYLKIPV